MKNPPVLYSSGILFSALRPELSPSPIPAIVKERVNVFIAPFLRVRWCKHKPFVGDDVRGARSAKSGMKWITGARDVPARSNPDCKLSLRPIIASPFGPAAGRDVPRSGHWQSCLDNLCSKTYVRCRQGKPMKMPVAATLTLVAGLS